MSDIDLGPAIAAMYAAPPEQFVARRTDIVKQAKASGDTALAKRAAGLRKPTRSAWLVNLLAAHEAADLAQVLDLGAALSAAHRDAAGEQLRELTQLRNQLVRALVAKAISLGAQNGYSAPESARQEVSETVTAALADPQLAELVRGGLLTQCVRASGFGPVDMFNPLSEVISPPENAAAAAERLPDNTESKSKSSGTGVDDEQAEVATPKGPDLSQVRAAERALVRAESQAENAEVAYAKATTEHQTAAAERDRISALVTQLQEQLMNAQEQLATAEENVAQADASIKRSDCARAEANASLEAARDQFRALGLEP